MAIPTLARWSAVCGAGRVRFLPLRFGARALGVFAAAVVAVAPSFARADENDDDSPPAAGAALPAPAGAPPAGPPTARTQPAVPTPAWPACGEDLVVLHDGGMVRGAIVELRPREQITLRLATGKVVIVPWSDVHHVEQGGPVAATCTNGGGTASAPLDEAGTVTLALEGMGFTLEAKVGTEWGSVCVSPCRAEVPRNGYYRVNGPMIRPSTPFRAQGKAGDVVSVKVDPASSGAFAAGVVSVTVGGVLLFVAYVEALEVLGGSSSYDSSYSYYGTSRRSSSDSHGTILLGSLAAGFAATILGGALLHGNMRTAVKQAVDDAVWARPKTAPEPSRVAPFKEAWFKRPSVLDPKPAAAIPVMTGTF